MASEPSISWIARCRTSRPSCSVWLGLDQMASAARPAAMARSITQHDQGCEEWLHGEAEQLVRKHVE
jgi:hypothetical protein